MAARSGNSAGRLTLSEPRSRARAYRVSNSTDATDDQQSTGATGGLSLQEDRLNNWDFTDWRPSSTFEPKKKIKKGNEEKGQERSSSLRDGGSPVDGGRAHTPSTFPRTKVTASMPASERIALENLRTRLTFTDGDVERDVQRPASSNERNNERYIPRRAPMDVSLERRQNEVGARPKQPTRPHNRNVLREEVNHNQMEQDVDREDLERPDSNQIVGRLMQIRDYIKQATTMMERIQSSTDPGDNRRMAQLEQVVERLREQENKYLDLLLSLSASREDSVMMRNSSSQQEEQEDEELETEEAARPTGETESEAATELDMQSQTSDDTNVCDLSKKNEELEALRQQHELLQKMLQQQEQLKALQGRQTALMELQREAEQRLQDSQLQEGEATSQSDNEEVPEQLSDAVPPELQELRQRLTFLKSIYQNSLAAVDAVREQELQDEDEEDEDNNEEEEEQDDEEVEEEDEEEEGAVGGGDLPPQAQLKDIHVKLNYLKNLYEMKDSAGSDAGVNRSEEDVGSGDTPGELFLLAGMDQSHLQDKLVDLQTKKQHMDQLLNELQALRSDKYAEIQNNHRQGAVDMDVDSTTSSQAHMMASIAATASANSTAAEAEEMLSMMEAQRKMKKLEEVKERLNELRSLVHYYQSGNDLIHGEEAPGQQQNAREKERKEGMNELMSRFHSMEHEIAQLQVDGSTVGRSDTTSQQSESAADWGAEAPLDDDELAEKVQRLQSAKEKLRRLQELVRMVQTNPDSNNVDEEQLLSMAASLQQTAPRPQQQQQQRRPRMQQDDEDSISSNPDPVPAPPAALQAATAGISMSEDEREAYYAQRVQQQRAELEQLMDERCKLLNMQDELQRLHDSMPQEPSPQQQQEQSNRSENNKKSTPPPRRPEPPRISPNNALAAVAPRPPRQEPLPPPPPPAATATTDAVALLNMQAELQRTGTGSVTFQEPLETVITNDELYGRMRQQRILREELRQKTKELQDMMRKDRPRKHYSRNQDNQRDNHSDNISFSTKSELFGGSASVDQTMATWGGSTVDNMEGIEEDEAGRRDAAAAEAQTQQQQQQQQQQDNNNDEDDNEECDDGYPSDGIVQVEEEEEAADDDSDDHDTYTIEEEPYIPRGRRRRGPANSSSRAGAQGEPAGSTPSATATNRRAGAPFSGRSGGRDYRYNYWAPDNNEVLNNVRPSPPLPAPRGGGGRRQQQQQGGGERGLRREVQAISRQVTELSHLCANMAQTQQEYQHNQQQQQQASSSGSGLLSNQTSHLQAQMLLSLNQCYSQLLHQQQDMGERFRQLEQIVHLNQSPVTVPTRNTQNAASNSFNMQPVFPENFFTGGIPTTCEPTYSAQSSSGGFYSRSGVPNSRSVPQYPSSSSATAPYYSPPQRPPVSNFRSSQCEETEDEERIDTIQARDEGVVPRLNLEDTAASSCVTAGGAYGDQRHRRDERGQLNISQHREDAVIGERFPLSRACAGAQLASQRVYEGGLSSGISGAMAAGGTDTASSVSSAPPQPPPQTAASSSQQQTPDFSLFETLRETIYSEVATLISQNEKRPHYLIELFRELQLLSTDYLRQRALYAVQDLVAKYLTSADSPQQQQRPRQQAREQAQLYARGPRRNHHKQQNDESPATFDYVEPVETTSSMSTPNSSGHLDSPFAQDSLGDTVIHLDKALQRMREYERKHNEARQQREREGAAGGGSEDLQQQQQHSPSSVIRSVSAGAIGGSIRTVAACNRQPQPQPQSQEGTPSAASSSAQDNTDSEDNPSVSEALQYPRIDPAQLDSQIKGVMTEIIPVLKEHMDDVCSQQLLRYIGRLVLALTKNAGAHDNKPEFVRFFHKQLASILQDTLTKFEGRKMRDCGEDLLVDLSEILFNELAFFRLMQDLDDPKAKVKASLRQWRSADQDSQTSTETLPTQDELENLDDNNEEQDEDEDEEESSSEEEEDADDESEINSEEVVDDEAEEKEDDAETEKQANKQQQQEIQMENGDDEELGKDRDDELAARVDIVETERDEEEEEEELNMSSRMKIMLAPSETKPMTRIGSDEDDEGDDESLSAEDISETAVSRDAEKEKQDDKDREEEEEEEQPNPQPIQINGSGGVGEGLLTNGEATEEVTLDDLPAKLTNITQEELASKISEETANNNLDNDAILEAVAAAQSELAGSGDNLKEPGSVKD